MGKKMDSYIEEKAIILEKVGELSVAHHLNPTVLSVDWEKAIASEVESMLLRISHALYGVEERTITEEGKYEEIPATLWDGFKLSWFPQWLINIYPVQYRKFPLVVTHKHFRICPHINLPNRNRIHSDFLGGTSTQGEGGEE